MMAAKPYTIAHLTDLHLTDAPGGVLEEQARDLDRVVDQILAAKPDLVTLTGDLWGRTVPHRPTWPERSVLERALVRLAQACPVEVLGGNHDHAPSVALLANLGGVFPIMVREKAGSTQVHTPAGPVWLYWLAYPTRSWLLAGQRPQGVQAATEAVERSLAGLLTAWGRKSHRRRSKAPEIPQLFMGHFQVRGSMLSGGEVLQTGEVEIGRDALALLDVDYGALGHVHERQEVAPGWWYAGDPWCVDYGERGDKGWNLVELVAGEQPRVTFQSSGSRPWVTLRYRWSSDRDGDAPKWVDYPEDLDVAAGAMVRARLVVPSSHAATCPWDAELVKLEAAGAFRVKPERRVELVNRVRAPQVAAAESTGDKVEAVWSTQDNPPEPQDREARLEALAELETQDDDQILATTQALIRAAKGLPSAA